MGFYDFTDGEALTAALLENNISKQVVMVFSSAAARTTALSGVLTEGMLSYLQDVDALQVYTGSSWVNVALPSDYVNVRSTDLALTTTAQTVASVSVNSAGTYLMEATIFVNGMTNGAAATYGNLISWTTPTLSMGYWCLETDGGGSNNLYRSDYSAYTSSQSNIGTVDSGGTTYHAHGIFTASATGTLSIKAQKATGSGTGSAKAGSFLSIRQVS